MKRKETDMNYEAKKQARIERYKARAEKASQESTKLHEEARKMASIIPFGQPILIGHHSEKADRNYRKRIHKKMFRFVEESQKAEYWKDRAKAAENNRVIYSDDPEAVIKLKERIQEAEKLQEIMKSANCIIRSKPKNERTDEKIKRLMELGLKTFTAEKLFIPDFCGRIGFADYQLTNNNANIRRMKQRLSNLEATSQAETVEVNHDGFKVVENIEENRVQIIFPGKPSYEIRQILKQNGFRWSPSQGAWQRHLNNAGKWAAQYVTEKINQI